eukprot:GILJ01003112.1.p1 GENE.GILJ01003112.1~~GILJ01003112.1.p1  ORF type:complete len:524 (-),score=57.95 GILJ01003112.1:185-1729(-)
MAVQSRLETEVSSLASTLDACVWANVYTFLSPQQCVKHSRISRTFHHAVVPEVLTSAALARPELVTSFVDLFSKYWRIAVLDVSDKERLFTEELFMRFAQALPSCSQLKSLSLELPLTLSMVRALAEFIVSCSGLEDLNIPNSSLISEGSKPSDELHPSSKEALSIVAVCVADCPELRALNISGNAIGDFGCESLVTGLQQASKLQVLDLSSNFIGSVGALALCDAMSGLRALKNLNLSGNCLGPEGIAILMQGLEPCRCLETLDISANGLRPQGAAVVAECIAGFPQLKSLNLRQNWFGPEGMALLAPSLPACQALQHLNLSANKMFSEGAEYLAEVLPCCASLQVLLLQENTIGPGLRPLLCQIIRCPRLHELNLSNNALRRDGALFLASKLFLCEHLTSLDVSNNDIQDAAVDVMAAVCGSSLQHLVMKANRIGPIAAGLFGPMLVACRKLISLDLRVNAIGVEAPQLVQYAIRSPIRNVNIRLNALTDAEKTRIQKLVTDANQRTHILFK